MRINRFVALATGLSRRAADQLIADGQVAVNGAPAQAGQDVSESDTVIWHGQKLKLPATTTIMLNKPVGYVCSRDGQGSPTIYDLLPPEFHKLKPVGRLDKDSSGLLLLTNNGSLAQQLTHPSYAKTKVYQVNLNHPLQAVDQKKIEQGVTLDDGLSRLQLSGHGSQWTITMHEGRNRQIRRTFDAVGYQVVKLHRNQFGPYKLDQLTSGKFKHL